MCAVLGENVGSKRERVFCGASNGICTSLFTCQWGPWPCYIGRGQARVGECVRGRGRDVAEVSLGGLGRYAKSKW